MATLTQWQILRTLTKRNQGTNEILEKLHQKGITLTLRSVQRNLGTLSGEFPIISDHKNPAGWKWSDSAELFALPTMDSTTALTLRLSEQYLAEMLPRTCVRALQPYVAHAHKLLDEISETGVGWWPRRVARISRQQHLISPTINDHVLDEVFQAVLEGKQLEVSYRSIGDESSTKRKLHPLGLVFDSEIIYLVATVWDYPDFRQFALHRISDAKKLDQPAKCNDTFCLDKYIAEGNFDFPRQQGQIRIRLLANKWLARHLEERKLAEDQIISKRSGGFLVEASVIETAQLKWWLLGLGTQVEVLEPESLRQSISTTIEGLHNIYNPKDRK
ncbi:MAG: hypothetical protein B6I36_08405 [Desulfobacteraceae bacterium 4572_35.1]|jgi:predicted DNA-binding transcriptional regulator YafY|nr:MAG: hypothetical protein B6I36_08405 [Desulfobacteraceae bacterium 4572_35.1]